MSILGEHRPYVFPNKEELALRLKDVLEDEVDEKYYLNTEKAEQLIATITEKNNITNPTVVDASVNEPKTKEVMNTVTARYDAGIQNYKSIGGAVVEPKIKQVGNTTPNPKRENPQTGRTYDADGLAPTLNTMQGGNRQPQIVEPLGTLASGASEQFGVGYMHGLSKTLKANKHDISVLEGVDVHPFSKKLEFNGYKQKEISPCLLATDYKAPKTVLEGIPIKNATNKGYLMAKDGDGVDLAYPTSNTRRGRVQEDISQTLTTDDSKGVVEASDKPKLVGGIGEKNFGKQHRQGNRIYDSEAVAMCLNAQPVGNAGGYSYLYKTDYRIRKLTPLECWRLMGCSDEDFKKAESVCSNSQLYKQAGNAIVVDVLEMILGQLLLGGDELLEYREFKNMLR